ncbi:MAG: hypothetical protein E7422_10265 [Ruminococcaceae bacterium]|nr:hypothetical protein [Oscillospiraceae bacterium]
MRIKILHKAKLVVRVFSPKGENRIYAESVFDNRTQQYWTPAQIAERGIEWFLNLADLKETLNWNLNGDEAKYQFQWGQSAPRGSEGVAYVFD